MNSDMSRIRFHVFEIYMVLQSIVMITLNAIIGTIPSYFGYTGRVAKIGLYLYYRAFSEAMRVEIQCDEKSRAILDEIKGPVIYIANHQSVIDCIVVGNFIDNNTAIFVKKEMKYIPFIGFYMWTIGTIFLDRKNKEKSTGQIDKVVESIRERNVSVWVFPEGTRSHLSEPGMLPFKSGAFRTAVRAKVPIVPIVFENYHHIFDWKKKLMKPGKITCKVLPPICTDNINDDIVSITKLSNECHSKMLETQQSLFDKKKQ